MSRSILILAFIVAICFANNVTSKKIALTGFKHKSPSPTKTSISSSLKVSTRAPAPTTPPPKPHFPTFQVVKRETVVESCGNYQIPNFDLELFIGDTCLVDENGLMFGTCYTGISDPRSCGWPGVCVDEHACTSSCGRTSVPNISATTCGGNDDGNDYCAMWYLVSDTYVYTSITCSDKQSWKTWEATFVTPISVDLATYFSTTTARSETSETSATPTPTVSSKISSILTISIGSPTDEGNSTVDTYSPDSIHSLGAIIGGIFGGIGVVSILGVLVWLFHRRRESNKRASRALAYDPGHSSSEDHDLPNAMSAIQAESVHHSVRSSKPPGSPSQGYVPTGYTDSPLGSPNIDNGSIHTGGILTPSAMSPSMSPSFMALGDAQSMHSAYADQPLYEMPADPIRPRELPA
ncbi:uncharacterized protein EAF01_003518 [Botrytis porri]|uniref:Mid2 domain-containing protein n=1 Tax=Botrytis porri TaxID=87229 RepID=A0A4Z1KHQ5_9HELO|nr:uncharacterized protein EAF01_003518 [Botrytis porri]KAF7909800.1 hypothetical protein EAF01_003518 [Botrytis porri]TGO85631.1 hypothetical protein BPOR_0378g00080 [Botrytis porri]